MHNNNETELKELLRNSLILFIQSTGSHGIWKEKSVVMLQNSPLTLQQVCIATQGNVTTPVYFIQRAVHIRFYYAH